MYTHMYTNHIHCSDLSQQYKGCCFFLISIAADRRIRKKIEAGKNEAGARKHETDRDRGKMICEDKVLDQA